MRVRYGAARRRSKKRVFREARGNFLGRSKLLRTVKETVLRARAFAYRDRRTKKREFRALWITRITAACRQRGLSYSVFIHGLKNAGIDLDRKMLSELAISDANIFDEVVDLAREAATKASAA